MEMFFQIFLITFLGCFQSAISIDNHNEIEQRFGAGDILGFKIMDGEPMNGPFTVSTLTIFKKKKIKVINFGALSTIRVRLDLLRRSIT